MEALEELRPLGESLLDLLEGGDAVGDCELVVGDIGIEDALQLLFHDGSLNL